MTDWLACCDYKSESKHSEIILFSKTTGRLYKTQTGRSGLYSATDWAHTGARIWQRDALFGAVCRGNVRIGEKIQLPDFVWENKASFLFCRIQASFSLPLLLTLVHRVRLTIVVSFPPTNRSLSTFNRDFHRLIGVFPHAPDF